MTSQVNPNNIDGSYPVAGQDNDSQGFRDNFTNIRNNFTFIKSEVEDLQNKAVLKSSLTNSTLNNDFAGNAISNATLTSWRETYNNVTNTASGVISIDFANGNSQKIGVSGAISSLTFFWPDNTSGYYVSIKLWINVVNTAHTITFATAPTLGDPDTIAGYNAGVLSFNAAELANNNDYFFEIFTIDGGSTLGITDLIRNRDVDLSGMSITGNLVLDGLTVSTYDSSIAGNVSLGSSINATTGSNVVIRSNVGATNTTTGALVVTGGVGIAGNLVIGSDSSIAGNVSLGSSINATTGSNVVIRSNVGATNTTTGALVVTGGVGIAGNLVIGSNIITTGGRINPNYAYVNLTNSQNFFANINYQTLYFDTASSATIANARIALPSPATDGREINMSFLAPITALWINSGNTAMVKWFPNASVSSGNVSVKFVYSTAAGTWLKSA
jgi:hypothetical protein